MRKLFLAVLVLLVSSSLWAQDTRFYPSGGLQQGAGGTLTAGGPILLPDGSTAAPSLAFSSSTSTGLFRNSDGLHLATGAVDGFIVAGVTLAMRNDGTLRWSSTSNPAGTPDLFVVRDAANTLALRNSTNAQTFNIYNTYTDGSNYERGYLKWNTNMLVLGASAAGSGAARNLTLYPGGGNVFSVNILPANNEVSGADDSGALGGISNRWANIYLTRAIQGSKTKTLTESAATSFVQIDLAASTGTGGDVSYCIFAKDASNTQMRCGTVAFAAARTSGSSITCTVGTPSTDLEATGITSGTLTNTFTCDATAGTNFKLQANALSSLTQSVLEIHYRLNMMDVATVTPQ